MNDFGLILIGIAVRATALAMLGLMAMGLLRRRGPATAAMTTSTTLAVLVAVSVLALSPWPRWRLPTSDAPTPVEPPAAAKNTVPDGPGEGSITPVTPIKSDPNLASAASAFFRELGRELTHPARADGPVWRWPAWTALAFATGLGLAIGRLGLGLWAVRRLGHRSRAVDDPALLAEVHSIRSEMGMSRSVDVFETAEVDTPATTGWRRPAILLPVDWRDWDSVERRAVLSHELAHVLRGDYLAGLMAQLSLSIHFYHPLVHALTSRLKLDQELAADAWGARLTGGHRPYLNALARLALRRNPRPAAWPARPFLPDRGTFLRRIEMLRDPKMTREIPMPRRGRAMTVAALAIAGLVVAGFRGGNAQEPGQPQVKSAVRAPGYIDPTCATADVRFVADIRPAEILRKQPAWALIVDRPGDSTFSFGAIKLKNAEIEQVLVLGLDRKLEAVQRPPAQGPLEMLTQAQVVMAIRANRPIELRATLSGDFAPFEQDGVTYYARVAGPDAKAADPDRSTRVRRLDARTILIGQAADMARPPLVVGQPVAHAWDDAWKSTGVGQVRMAFETSWLNNLAGGALGQPGQGIRGIAGPMLDKVKAYGIDINATDGLALDVVGLCGSEADAEQSFQTLKATMTLLNNALTANVLPSMKSGPGPNPMAPLADGLEKTMAEARVERVGSRIRLGAKLDAAALKIVSVMGESAKVAADRSTSVNHLKQLGLAMHNYAFKNGAFPPAVLFGPDGKTPHSWRVALLPYIGEEKLYARYKLDEPWDGPNNRKLIDQMPEVFGTPGASGEPPRPAYFALIGPSTMFPDRKEGMKINAITDGSAYTILLAEAKRDIPWTKPEDISCPDEGALPALGGYFPGGFNVVFADGAVLFLKDSLDPAMLRALTTRNRGEVVQWPN